MFTGHCLWPHDWQPCGCPTILHVTLFLINGYSHSRIVLHASCIQGVQKNTCPCSAWTRTSDRPVMLWKNSLHSIHVYRLFGVRVWVVSRGRQIFYCHWKKSEWNSWIQYPWKFKGQAVNLIDGMFAWERILQRLRSSGHCHSYDLLFLLTCIWMEITVDSCAPSGTRP